MEYILSGTALQPVSNSSVKAASLQQEPSGKSHQTTSGGCVDAKESCISGIDEPVDFQSLRNEVNAFGAKHLDKKKDKRMSEKRFLDYLGLPSAKAPRTSVFQLF
jgi:hypothetical protein